MATYYWGLALFFQHYFVLSLIRFFSFRFPSGYLPGSAFNCILASVASSALGNSLTTRSR